MRQLLLALVVALLLGGACGGAGDDDVSIRVFAAASLTDAFGDLARAFEEANPATSVELNFAGSSSLREQILEGAPADVFASADTANMDRVVEAGVVADPRTFATNRLQIAVPSGNPAEVEGLSDLADEDLLVGLCAAEVPCGVLARRALERAGVRAAPDTNEPDVRALLTKIEAGELDAGIVYVTDVAAAGDDVTGIELPAEIDVVARYPIGTVTESGDADRASAFVAFVLAAEGQAILRRHGFGSP